MTLRRAVFWTLYIGSAALAALSAAAVSDGPAQDPPSRTGKAAAEPACQFDLTAGTLFLGVGDIPACAAVYDRPASPEKENEPAHVGD